MKIISWNIARRKECWEWLLDLGADLALLQEAAEPPLEITKHIIGVNPGAWQLAGQDCDRPRSWRAAVVRLSDRVEVEEWIEAKPIHEAGAGELAVSRLGTIAVARVRAPGVEPFVCISMYAPWMTPHMSTQSGWRIISDASAHRIVSDLSALVGRQYGHRILAAGDLNILYGYESMAARIGRNATRPYSAEWRHWNCASLGLSILTADGLSRGRTSFRTIARMSPPTIRRARRLPRRRASWTSRSPLPVSPTP